MSILEILPKTASFGKYFWQIFGFFYPPNFNGRFVSWNIISFSKMRPGLFFEKREEVKRSDVCTPTSFSGGFCDCQSSTSR
jgi:hypothetical protein